MYQLSKVEPCVGCEFCGALYIRQGPEEAKHGWNHLLGVKNPFVRQVYVPNWWSFIPNVKPTPNFKSKRKLKAC